ncbi:MAG: hypothetical protein Q4D02_02885 [Clostridia bacterium]|nr:hypothetical protein [Clostridia bacterium]
MDENYSSIENVEKKWGEIISEIQNYRGECLNDLAKKSLLFMTLMMRKVKRSDQDTLKFLLGTVSVKEVFKIIEYYISFYTNLDKEKVRSSGFILKGECQVPFGSDLEACRYTIIDFIKPCRYAMLICDSINNYLRGEMRKPTVSYSNRQMDQFLKLLSEEEDLFEDVEYKIAEATLENLVSDLIIQCEKIREYIHEKVLEKDFTIHGRSISMEKLVSLDGQMAEIIYAAKDVNNKEALKILLENAELIQSLCFISDQYYKYCEDVICTLDDIYELLYTFL